MRGMQWWHYFSSITSSLKAKVKKPLNLMKSSSGGNKCETLMGSNFSQESARMCRLPPMDSYE